MKYVIGGILIGCIISLFLYPYFSLIYLKDIASELEKLGKQMKEIMDLKGEQL